MIFHEGSFLVRSPIVSVEKSFYTFGGTLDLYATAIIAAFDTIKKEWKFVGELNQARYAHGVFIQEGEFVVVGGFDSSDSSSLATERCTSTEDSIDCILIDPMLYSYSYYPAIMPVTSDYCSE